MIVPSPIPPDLLSETPADAQGAVLAPVQSFEKRIADLEACLERDSSTPSMLPPSEPLRVKRQPPPLA